MKITVSEVSEASADIVWTGAQLRGHSSGAVGFVLRQLQAPGLLDIKQTRAACFPQVCVWVDWCFSLITYLEQRPPVPGPGDWVVTVETAMLPWWWAGKMTILSRFCHWGPLETSHMRCDWHLPEFHLFARAFFCFIYSWFPVFRNKEEPCSSSLTVISLPSEAIDLMSFLHWVSHLSRDPMVKCSRKIGVEVTFVL